MLLADFFYNGVARWQLGFDNPNKAAVLAVELILVGLALVAATRRLVLRVLGAVLTVGSLYVLLHIRSHGAVWWHWLLPPFRWQLGFYGI